MPLQLRVAALRTIVGDCASDPPLGATARLLATVRADEVVFGLGVLALRHGGGGELALAVADAGARAAIVAAIARAGANVRVLDVPDAWPGVTAAADATIVSAAELVARRRRFATC